LWQKAMDKKKIQIIWEQRKNEREEKKLKNVTNSQNVADKVVQRLVEKWHRVDFNQASSTLAIKEACKKNH
jgi:hypothetical protein